jgi:SH3 domain-containing YSC84-like protein 1
MQTHVSIASHVDFGHRRLRQLLALIAAFLKIATLAPAQEEESPDHRLSAAHTAFHEMMDAPDKGIPLDLFNRSECIVIIPGVKKAAFIVGAKYGRGFASCRRGPSRRFGAPAAIRIEGGSWGLQIGGSSTDVFLLIMNRNGEKKLLADKFTIGGEAAAVAGPVGRDATAQTDVLLHAEILSWSRSRGIFGGLSLEGATMRPDGSENEKLYGHSISNQEILEGSTNVPPAGHQLVVTLNRYLGSNGEPGPPATNVAQGLESGRVTLHNVHFATGKFDIESGSEPALSAAAQALKDHPDWKVTVEGFTDNTGNADANVKLSQARADAVLEWLVNNGIDRSRLEAKGYGEERPVASNDTADGRRRNRRVELVRM